MTILNMTNIRYENLTKQNKNTIVEEYTNGIGYKKIAKKYSFTDFAVKKTLNDNNIYISSNKYKTEIIELIINKYNSGELIKDISNELNIHPNTITRYLIKNNITISNHKYIINDDCFNTIDNQLKAYTLGFLFADGWVVHTKKSFGIQLQGGDSYILNKMNKIFSDENVVKNLKNKKYTIGSYSSINIYSEKICNRLCELGCIPKKSLILDFNNNLQNDLSIIYQKDFIRGYFDGDGCIYIRKKNNKFRSCGVHFLGTKMFLTKIQNILYNNNIHSKLSTYCNIYRLDIYRQSDIYNLFNYMYDDVINKTYLIRKYDKFIEFCNYFNR